MFKYVHFNQNGSMRKIVLLGVIAGFLIWGCQPEKKEKTVKKSATKQQDSTIAHTYDKFGIKIDSLQSREHSIKRNESLYLILDKYGFGPQEIYSITKQARDIVDLESLRPGQKYWTYASSDNSKEVEKLVWQPTPIEYVVFNWQADSLEIYKAARPLTSKRAVASGTIDNSLYQTISSQDASPLLAYKLADIFAWQINFFGLRDGDSFNVAYHNQYIDDEYYGIGDIIAAEFTHRGETFQAYKFQHGTTDGYFDEDGNSVQKALLKAPFKFSQRISSGFNRNRFHPILKKRVPHYGTDYAAPPGTPVLAVGDGRVTTAGYSRGEGNHVKIKHNTIYETAYLHLSDFANGIHPGARVEQGEVIGYVGSSGLATGPHLHYSLYKNDRPVNSLSVELPSAESVPDSLMNEFVQVRDSLDQILNNPQKDSIDVKDDKPAITEVKAK